MTFSFFANRLGGGTEIRGRQIAERLGGRINPESGYDDDVCIYILGKTPVKYVRYVYHDVMDCGFARLSRVSQFAGHVIATSNVQYGELRKLYPKKDVYLIPQHHCNFKNEKRPDRPVLRVGCIGGDSAVQWPHYSMDRMLKEVGLEWVFCSDYHRRRKVVSFYRHLDIQVSWRPTHTRGIMLHLNTLKLCNAGSFGIPTVAFPEPAYAAEWPSEALYEDTMGGLITTVKRLASQPGLYAEMSQRALNKAQEYHIDNVLKLYMELPGALSV